MHLGLQCSRVRCNELALSLFPYLRCCLIWARRTRPSIVRTLVYLLYVVRNVDVHSPLLWLDCIALQLITKLIPSRLAEGKHRAVMPCLGPSAARLLSSMHCVVTSYKCSSLVAGRGRDNSGLYLTPAAPRRAVNSGRHNLCLSSFRRSLGDKRNMIPTIYSRFVLVVPWVRACSCTSDMLLHHISSSAPPGVHKLINADRLTRPRNL